ncbi:MAG: hypothetical protein ABUL60_14830 [Myxococcales bacterium]
MTRLDAKMQAKRDRRATPLRYTALANLPADLAEVVDLTFAEVFVEADGWVRLEGLTFFRRYETMAELRRNIHPVGNGCSGRNRHHNANVARAYDAAQARDAAAARKGTNAA